MTKAGPGSKEVERLEECEAFAGVAPATGMPSHHLVRLHQSSVLAPCYRVVVVGNHALMNSRCKTAAVHMRFDIRRDVVGAVLVISADPT